MKVLLLLLLFLSLIPASSISSGNLTPSSSWFCVHDTGTSGDSSLTMTYPVTLGEYSDVREYNLDSYYNYGGDRCSIKWGKDTSSNNFIYDVWVNTPTPTLIGNLELDMNQVTADGNTVIMAFQCSSWSSKWEYTSVANGSSHWAPTQISCNPKTWTSNQWHHIQFYMSRDNSGNVTYHWVAFDGIQKDINITTFESLSLGWSLGSMVVNFQIDPALSTGNPIIVYSRLLTIYRWVSPDPPSKLTGKVGKVS